MFRRFDASCVDSATENHRIITDNSCQHLHRTDHCTADVGDDAAFATHTERHELHPWWALGK